MSSRGKTVHASASVPGTAALRVSAVVAGLILIGVQVDDLLVNVVTTTGVATREALKLVVAVASLVGISGSYLRRVTQTGLLGVLGYVALGAGYLLAMSRQVVGAIVLPAPAGTAPDSLADVLDTVAGHPARGDVGQLHILVLAAGLAYLTAGLLVGTALCRANASARWGAALLALAALSAVTVSVFPRVDEHLLAVAAGVTVVGLGCARWVVSLDGPGPIPMSWAAPSGPS